MINNVSVIFPCYNESKRINLKLYSEYLSSKSYNFIFVDDGSNDDTNKILTKYVKNINNAHLITLKQNMGKAEAVRQGILYAKQQFDTDLYLFWDADLSTPLNEIDDFISINELYGYSFVSGCRLNRLGANIQRSSIRHFMSRIFATLTSYCLNMEVYDTQCGSKMFSKNIVDDIFSESFLSRWLFDIEIFFRIKKFPKFNKFIYELPLNEWVEKGETKLRIKDWLVAPFYLLYFRIKYR